MTSAKKSPSVKTTSPKKTEHKEASPPSESPVGPHTKHHEKIEVIIRKQLLGEAPVEKHFIVSDGRKLKNVKDLVDALETMSDEVFSYHANEFKNDFATWLRDVFSHEHIAREVEAAKRRLDTQRVIMKRLIDDIEKIARKPSHVK